MIKQFAKILGSQISVGLIGLVTLPIIARNFQAEIFGQFSLFLLLVASVSMLDVCRPILIRQFAENANGEAPISVSGLVLLNVIVVTSTAIVLGTTFLPFESTVALIMICGMHAGASPDYSDVAVRSGAGNVQMYRNVLWAIAYIAVAVSGFFTTSPYVYLLPFVLASAVIVVIYRGMAGGHHYHDCWTNLTKIGAKSIREMWHVFSFNVVVAFVASVDKIALERFVTGENFGRYMAQSSLALRGNLVGTSLGQAIYPQLANKIESDGYEETAEYFSRIFCYAVLAFGVLILVPILASRQIIQILFGELFLVDIDVFAFVLVGVYLQMFGMLLTPWQRARADFSTSRNAYFVAAFVMAIGAVFLIPAFGMAGAIWVYMLGRIGDAIVFVHEYPTLRKTAHYRRFGPWIGLNFLAIVSLTVFQSGFFT